MMDDLFSYAAQPPSPEEAPTVFNVTQLSNRLRAVVEGTFDFIAVEGEVSGLKRASSGHVYFNLKDDENVLAAILWRSTASRLKTPLEEGVHMVAYGKLTTYGARSKYQMIVDRLEVAGQGALMQRFEALKAKLSAEGLFDEQRKKPLPYLPQTIGIITSPTGAVIEDMLNRLRKRAPATILLWPVAVQGPQAAGQIAAAIKGFNTLPVREDAPAGTPNRPDVLIIARGGGSLEDLWPFNEEEVVRALAASTIPTVSGVGHEPDVTLCDYAADHRSPTPTAAATEVTPDLAELTQKLEGVKATCTYLMRQRLAFARQHVQGLRRALPDPQSTLNQLRLRLEDKTHRLRLSAMQHLRYLKHRVEKQQQALQHLSPLSPLEKGFVYLTNSTGAVVKSAATTQSEVTIHFKDGQRQATLAKPEKTT